MRSKNTISSLIKVGALALGLATATNASALDARSASSVRENLTTGRDNEAVMTYDDAKFIEYYDSVYFTNPVAKTGVIPVNEYTKFLEDLTDVLADKAGVAYRKDGKFDGSDLSVLRNLTAYTPIPGKSEISLRNAARASLPVALAHLNSKYPAVAGTPVSPATREATPAVAGTPVSPATTDDRWYSVLNAKTVDDVISIIGRGSGAVGYADLVKRAPISPADTNHIVDNIYGTVMYTIVEDVAKGNLLLEKAIPQIDALGLDYLALRGIKFGEDSLLPKDSIYTLEDMLNISIDRLVPLARGVYATSEDPKAKEQLDLIEKISRISSAQEYMNSGWGISLTQKFGNATENEYALNDVSNGRFSADLSTRLNVPSLDLTLGGLVRLQLGYDERSGSVYFTPTGEDREALSEYVARIGTLSADALFNVLGFLPESNRSDFNLWLGLGYGNISFSQEYMSEVVPQSLRNIQGLELLADGNATWNLNGNLIGLYGSVKTHPSTFPEQIAVSGGIGAKGLFFLNKDFALGLGGEIYGTSEPSVATPAIRGYVPMVFKIGDSSLEVRPAIGTDGFSLTGTYRF